MKRPLYFISDVHFYLREDAVEQEKTAKVSQLIDSVIAKQGTLFIVGDFFDFWFEYGSVVPRSYFNILAKLREMTQAGCKLHYIGGNHDFWLGDFIINNLSATVYNKPAELTIDNKRFYIAHGDGIDPADKGYLFLQKILRNKFFIKLFSFIPPGLAFNLAKLVSGTSRKYDNNSTEILRQNRKQLRTFAGEKFAEGFDCVVLGHYHLPEEYHTGDKTYLNCGDWLKHFTYGVFEEGKLRLEYVKNSD